MLSSVLTTCAVFIPLVFVKGMAGELFYDQAMSVTIVLLTSYVVTVLVIPVYYLIWYRRQPCFRPAPFLARHSVHEPMHEYKAGKTEVELVHEALRRGMGNPRCRGGRSVPVLHVYA